MSCKKVIYAFTNRISKNLLFISVLIAVCCLATAAQQSKSEGQRLYRIKSLDTLGGTSSRGNSINDRSWVAGFSNLAGNTIRHAALWRNNSLTDLGTLGSASRNSNVTWSVKNTNGLVVGISQTDQPMPLGEKWSCSAFFPAATATGYTCLGFVWEDGVMRRLNPLPGGNNSFATGANNSEIVGWAENGIRDPSCTANNQVLQFRPTVWQARNRQIRELPTLTGDSSGAATAINNRGQIVGISGDCDQAVGRYTARHAVLWDRGRLINLGNLGAEFWNTPTAINEHGDIVGFAGTPGDPEGNAFKAFIWTRRDGIKYLPPLVNLGHVDSEAYGINERGQVVGISCDINFLDCRAVMWEDGAIKDLNDFKANSFTPRLEQAKDINERGEITGRSFDPITNERRTFLAIPKRNDNDDD